MTLLSTIAATNLMAQEAYGVVQYNASKSKDQNNEALMECKEVARTSGSLDIEPPLTPLPPSSDSGLSTGTVIAGAVGGAVGAGLYQNIKSIASSLSQMNNTPDPKDSVNNSPEQIAKRAAFASCLKGKGYTVFPVGNLNRFPQDLPLPPEYVREKVPSFMQYEGWELYAKIPTEKKLLMAQAIDKKLIPNLAAYVKVTALKQTTKAVQFEVGQAKPYSYESYKGFSFEGKSTTQGSNVHITYIFLDVGAYILQISTASPLDTYEQGNSFEKDLPKYFIPTLIAGK